MDERKCCNCRHIGDLKPGQLFARCAFWCGCHPGANYPRAWAASSRDRNAYATLHCHVQPNAPACPNFAPMLELQDPSHLALREMASGVPAAVAMACAGFPMLVAS